MRHAVVLAGGQGTRLWPLSTTGRPKQLVPLQDGRTLLAHAIERASAVAEEVWVAAGPALVEAAGGALPGVRADRLIVEPSGRDTLAAVCLAMATVTATDPDAVVCVLTADHVITPLDDVTEALAAGFAIAEQEPRALVTFGVVPDRAATGYGWLELGPQKPVGFDVLRFREKPDSATAERMLAAGPDRFLWNSGMFVWRAATLLAAAADFAPGHAAAAGRPDPEPVDWEALGRLSVDHGVMEPATGRASAYAVRAVPLVARWLDIGSWSAYADLLPADHHGTAAAARVVALDAADCVVVSDDADHVVALLGVRDLVVVRTAGATLVCRAEDAQRVKELQALVAEQAPDRA